MKLVLNNTHKIRTQIKWFAIFMSLMLFQTSYMQLGTITAFASLSLVIVTAFFSSDITFSNFRLQLKNTMLLAFLAYVFISAQLFDYLPGSFSRLAGQILLCVVLIAMPSLNREETDFLEGVFIYSSVIYAVLVIISCYRMTGERYIHDDIILFNTALDPNFVGIPLVSASVLVLNNILCKGKRIISVIFYIVLTIAIMYTSSRGNLLSFMLVNSLLVFIHLWKNNVSLNIRIIWIVLVCIAVYYLLNYLAVLLPEQWGRMSELGRGSDNGRLVLWKRAFETWKESPIFGNGLGAMYKIHKKATHNTYLQLLSETGIIGILFFVSFIISTLKSVFRCDKTYFCMLLGCLVQIAFLDALDNRCFWVILCWLSALPKMKGELN